MKNLLELFGIMAGVVAVPFVIFWLLAAFGLVGVIHGNSVVPF